MYTGWIFHYLTSVAYALLPALTISIGTVVISYFIMQPAFGFGIAAEKTPKPMQARLRSLMTHTAFGVGLYVSAWLII